MCGTELCIKSFKGLNIPNLSTGLLNSTGIIWWWWLLCFTLCEICKESAAAGSLLKLLFSKNRTSFSRLWCELRLVSLSRLNYHQTLIGFLIAAVWKSQCKVNEGATARCSVYVFLFISVRQWVVISVGSIVVACQVSKTRLRELNGFNNAPRRMFRLLREQNWCSDVFLRRWCSLCSWVVLLLFSRMNKI